MTSVLVDLFVSVVSVLCKKDLTYGLDECDIVMLLTSSKRILHNAGPKWLCERKKEIKVCIQIMTIEYAHRANFLTTIELNESAPAICEVRKIVQKLVFLTRKGTNIYKLYDLTSKI